MRLPGEVFSKALIAPDTDSGNMYDFDGSTFRGVLDGNGFKISNLSINPNTGSDGYLGFIGYCSGQAKIINLVLENVSVTGSSGSYYVGGLCGCSYALIRNCYVSGSFNGNGHIIKNARYDARAVEYPELGVFRYVTGVVQSIGTDG